MSSEDQTFTSSREVTSSTTTTGDDGTLHTVTTTSTTEYNNGDVTSTSKLSTEQGDGMFSCFSTKSERKFTMK